MKIYNKIVLDKDNNIIEEDHFEYNGPISYCGGGGGSASEGASGSDKAAFTGDAAYSGSTKPHAPPGGGSTSLGSGTDYAHSGSPNTSGDYDDNVVDTYSPTTNIEDIHGEHTDPSSASYDPTYNPAYQARQTREQVFGTGEGAGENRWNPETQSMERVTNKTFAEHWQDTPDSIKYSPTLRFLYASGKNVSEWAKNKNWDISNNNNINTDRSSGDGNESQRMHDVAAAAPYIVSGTTQPTNSPAANWYQNLGNSNLTGGNTFNMATEYAAAKSKQQSILGSTSAVGQLAVNDSPFYNWLKDNSLDKGIL